MSIFVLFLTTIFLISNSSQNTLKLLNSNGNNSNSNSNINKNINSSNINNYSPYDYSVSPLNYYVDEKINGEIIPSTSTLYAKYDLKETLSKLDDKYYLNQKKISNKLIEQEFFVPTHLAKLEIEMYIQFFGFFKSTLSSDSKKDLTEKITIQLILNETVVAQKLFITKNTNFAESIYLNGTVFNIPPGKYTSYIKVVSSSDKQSAVCFRYFNNAFGYTNNDNDFNSIGGYLELFGVSV